MTHENAKYAENEKKSYSMYYRELFGALLLYGLVLIAALKYGVELPEGAWRTAVMVSPMLPFFLALWAIIRFFRRMDEYQKRWTLENIAVAFAVTAGATFTYGFLENVGYPRLSMFVVWPLMGGSWGVLFCVRGWLSR